MDYLDEYKKSTGSAENMRSQIQDYIADAARAKLAEDKVRTENETLRRENDACGSSWHACRPSRRPTGKQRRKCEWSAVNAPEQREYYAKDRDPCPGGQ